MPIASVKLIPGVNTEKTPTLNEAGISETQLIRFKDGLVQKLGGWERYYDFPIGSTVRALHGWEDLNGGLNLAVGAEESLSVISNGTNTNVTPQQTTTNVAPDFTTTMGSTTVGIVDASIVPSTRNWVWIQTPVAVGGITLQGIYPIATVTGADSYTIEAATPAASSEASGGAVPVFDTTLDSPNVEVTWIAHGFSVGDRVTFFVATSVGGLEIFGTYIIQAVPGVDEFVITAANTATSTATAAENGGDVRSLYYITIGPVALGSGYGLGGYGLGGYSTGVPAPSGEGTPISADDWTLDNWGEILVACPAGGAIYTWQPGSGFQMATVIGNGPLVNTGAFVAMPAQILVAYGSSYEGVQDPLLVRWSDTADFTNWTETAQTTAGSYRLSSGSRIVGALQVPLNALIWTDIDLWSMQYVQPPYVYSFQKIASGCGLVSQHAAAVLGGVIYWMSQGQFFRMADAGAEPIPCSVWDAVFQNIDPDNIWKVRAAPNSLFNEIGWFYPSLSSPDGENDSYVKFNTVEGTWDYGALDRTAWIDQSVLGPPIGAGTNTVIYQHETSPDADGAPLVASFKTGDFLLEEGGAFPYIDWVLPDFRYGNFGAAQDAELQVTLYGRNYPNSAVETKGPYVVSTARNYINTRLRKRQVALGVSSSDLGSFWRLGNVRFRAAADGRR